MVSSKCRHKMVHINLECTRIAWESLFLGVPGWCAGFGDY